MINSEAPEFLQTGDGIPGSPSETLSYWAEKAPSETFIVDCEEERSWSYSECENLVNALAAKLGDKTLENTGSLIICAYNHPSLCLYALAANRIGLRVVLYNPQLLTNSLEAVQRDNQTSIAVVDSKVAKQLGVSDVDEPVLLDLSLGKILIEASVFDLEGKARAEKINNSSGRADPFLTAYTAGTTSAPKGVDLSWKRVAGNAIAMSDALAFNEKSRFYNVLPLTYMGGFYNLFLMPLVLGASTCIAPIFGPISIFSFWDDIKQFEVNVIWSSPTILKILLDADRGDDVSDAVSRVKHCVCGFGPLSESLRRTFESRFGLEICENFGSTECLFVTVNNRNSVYLEGSKGTPIAGVTIRILDESGIQLGPGEVGEIYISSAYRLSGYRGATESENANTTEEFIPSGDLGYCNQNGELFISGRLKDVIIKGGINVAPGPIEKAIEAAEGVRTCAVVGRPDPVYGEDIIAFISIEPMQSEEVVRKKIESELKAKIHAAQRPGDLLFMQELPLSSIGKTDKNALRKIAEEHKSD